MRVLAIRGLLRPPSRFRYIPASKDVSGPSFFSKRPAKGGCTMKLVWGTRRRIAGLLLLAAGGCSKLIDHGASRCDKDSDCLSYSHYHPFCQRHVCVPSGL